MYNFLTKNGQLLAFGLGALITILFFVFVSSGLEEFEALEAAKDPKRFDTTIFNFGLLAARAMAYIAAAIAVLFGIYHAATNPKGAIKFLIGIVALLVIFGIMYNMADGSVETLWAEKFGITETTSKFIGGAITTTIGLCIIAAAAFVLGELRNFFK